MKKRKCTFKIYEDGNWFTYDGLFHQWGTSTVETSTGETVPYTVGIIELSNGMIKTTIPEYITFLEN